MSVCTKVSEQYTFCERILQALKERFDCTRSMAYEKTTRTKKVSIKEINW